MRNIYTLGLLFLVGLAFVSATLPQRNKRHAYSLSYNSIVQKYFEPAQNLPGAFGPETWGASDSVAADTKILLFNYATYDTAYARQMRFFVQKELPGVSLTDFFDGSPDYLEFLLTQQQAVVVSYPFSGDENQLGAYGKKLEAFARKGGVVVCTGTHDPTALHQLGLLDMAYSVYYDNFDQVNIHRKNMDNEVLDGVPVDFALQNFIYPAEFDDKDFITLAETEGLPLIGYKPVGKGAVYYLGIEYYSEEAISSLILKNVLYQAIPAAVAVAEPASVAYAPVKRRSEEVLFAGNNIVKTEIKIYPNPYFEKASLEINLEKATTVSVDVTSESGTLVANLLPQRQLSPGYYRIEVPDVSPGIYFVKCNFGNHSEVRRVVKVARQ